MITQQGFDNQLRTLEQTNILQNGLNQGLANNREQATSQFNILSAKLDAQTVMINDKFCQLEMREMQNTIAQLREEKATLTASALSQQQTQNIVGQLRPTAVPAYPSCSPYQAYTWGQVFGGWVTNPTRPITMETTDTTVTDLRCVEVADVAEVVLIEEQTQRIQLIRNM